MSDNWTKIVIVSKKPKQRKEYHENHNKFNFELCNSFALSRCFSSSGGGWLFYICLARLKEFWWFQSFTENLFEFRKERISFAKDKLFENFFGRHSSPRLFRQNNSVKFMFVLTYSEYKNRQKNAPNWTIIMLWKQPSKKSFNLFRDFSHFPSVWGPQLRQPLSAMLNLIYWHENYASLIVAALGIFNTNCLRQFKLTEDSFELVIFD